MEVKALTPRCMSPSPPCLRTSGPSPNWLQQSCQSPFHRQQPRATATSTQRRERTPDQNSYSPSITGKSGKEYFKNSPCIVLWWYKMRWDSFQVKVAKDHLKTHYVLYYVNTKWGKIPFRLRCIFKRVKSRHAVTLGIQRTLKVSFSLYDCHSTKPLTGDGSLGTLWLRRFVQPGWHLEQKKGQVKTQEIHQGERQQSMQSEAASEPSLTAELSSAGLPLL